MRDAYYPKAGGSPLPDIFGEYEVLEKFRVHLKDSSGRPPSDRFQTEVNSQIPWSRCTGKLAEGALRKYGWNPTEKEGEDDEGKKIEAHGESTSEAEEDPAPCPPPLAAAWVITKPAQNKKGGCLHVIGRCHRIPGVHF